MNFLARICIDTILYTSGCHNTSLSSDYGVFGLTSNLWDDRSGTTQSKYGDLIYCILQLLNANLGCGGWGCSDWDGDFRGACLSFARLFRNYILIHLAQTH
jgi:hypothetical protein